MILFMDLPIEIKDLLERLLDKYSIDEIKKSSINVIDKYNNQLSNNHIDNELDAKVYSIIRYPATFKAFSSALSYSLSHYDKSEIHSLIDFGAGSASASIASILSLDIKELTLIEKEEVMIDIGKYLLSNLSVDINYQYFKSDIVIDNYDINGDLIISSYVLNELKEIDILKVVDKMWKLTNKVLLVVEPGTPQGFKIIKLIREYLLSKGGYILAPCPHLSNCPLDNNDWCHFSTRVSRSKLHKLLKNGDAPYEDEKYSYIAFSKSPILNDNSRILRHPQINSGYISLEFCSKEGLKTIKITKKDKELFKAARKSSAGDEIKL